LEIVYMSVFLVAIVLQPTRDEEKRSITRYIFESIVVLCTVLYMFTQQIPFCFKNSWRRLWNSLPMPTYASWAHCLCIWIASFMRFSRLYTAQDILVAFAVIMGFIHLIHYHAASKVTGVFVVMIRKMIKSDLLRFSSIYLLLLIGFSEAFFLLFRMENSESFGSLPQSFISTFMMSFGDFHAEELKDLVEKSTARGIVTYIAFIAFVILGTILMLNLLIAMMGNTFSTVLEKAELEWRCHWAKMMVVIEVATSSEKAAPNPKNIMKWKDKWWIMIEEPNEGWKAKNQKVEEHDLGIEQQAVKLPPKLNVNQETIPMVTPL